MEFVICAELPLLQLTFNHLDSNPAVAARALFPQSGHSRSEKRQIFSDLSKENPINSFRRCLENSIIAPQLSKMYVFGEFGFNQR